MTGGGAHAMTDHTGARLRHGRKTVDGVDLHYALAGSGEPVVLLHGVPKTMFFWRHVIPLLTPHHTVVALDLRGFGGSARPPSGYDTRTLAGDVAAVMTALGFERFRVVGEDWGAAVAYAVAAFHRTRVVQLVYQETRLPGLDVPDLSPLPPEDPRTGWHRTLFALPHYPELLIAGRERAFWTYFMRRIMADPSAYTDADADEYTRGLEQPGGNHAVFELYRATETDAEQNRPQFADPLTCPVLAVGGRAYLAAEPGHQMAQVARDVRSTVIESAGHNIPLEAPEELARTYLDFFAGRDQGTTE
ncbi:alpha/beta fold hydrolase [Streptomyces sasae]|uniref:alpha/beta fold hydrolase n=1 Tax=Streptomyces sasae TaxID=1266772 RepID=UPI00292E05E9|nr:alpha/beta hydrolase [Streptomyces sasae]